MSFILLLLLLSDASFVSHSSLSQQISARLRIVTLPKGFKVTARLEPGNELGAR